MAGAGFKTFNTGDVLTASDVNTYLMQQTVMVFASAAARTTALGANVAEGMISYLKDTNAVEVYDGSNWVSSDDPNAIQNTIVDAKGDIITATANDTPARLAVGANGYTLVADSSQTTGLRYQPTTGNQNYLINGGFDIWQRGTSFGTLTNYQYLADRWVNYGGANTSASVSQQTLSGTNSTTYCLRWTAGSTSSRFNVGQALESAMVDSLKGQTITVSLYARVNSGNVRNYKLSIYKNATANVVNGGSWGSPVANTTAATLTTSFTQLQVSYTVPNDGTANGLMFLFEDTGTGLAADYVEMTSAKVEIGSVATAFTRAGGTIQGELAACQRYYWRHSCDGAYTRFGLGLATSTSNIEFVIPLKTTMRVAPTSIETSNLAAFDGVTLTASPTSITIDMADRNTTNIAFAKSSPFTQFRPYQLIANNTTSAYLAFSAEL